MSWIEIVFGLIAVSSTYLLHNKIKMCAVRASAGVTFFLCLVLSIIDIHSDESIFGIIFGASFVGMSSSERFNIWEVTLGTLIFLILSPLLSEYTPPIGGVLGFSAFLSLFFILII